MEACSDAIIKLYSSLKELAYYIRIGVNLNTATRIISADGQILYENSSPGVLSCYEPRAFWLSWADGRVQLAIQNQYGERILDYAIADVPTPHILSLTSYVAARWMFHRDVGASSSSSPSVFVVIVVVTGAIFF